MEGGGGRLEFAVGLFFMVASGVLLTPVCGGNVTYDHRSLIIDGKHRILISGSIHYARSTPEMWPDLIQKAKDGGLDAIQTNIFWSLHEPIRNQYDFEGSKDVVKFVRLVGEAGLYVFLGLGPYVGSHWNYGGFPVWLHFIPDIKLRTANLPYQQEVQRYTTKIVEMLKQEKLFAAQGGPIILCQIENNYGEVDSAYGDDSKTYLTFLQELVTKVLVDTGTPWVMSNQENAPDPLINTIDGESFLLGMHPNSNTKPMMFTACQTGRYTAYGEAIQLTTVDVLAYIVASFFQRGGSFINYYMYHGGTNFGHSAGGPFITASYDYGAPLDEYGLYNQPTYGHLKELHKALKLCEGAMAEVDPLITSAGKDLQSAIYKTDSGLCSAFISNDGNSTKAFVQLNGVPYYLPPYSVSILPDCKTVVFNSAMINSMSSVASFVKNGATGDPKSLKWSWANEPVGISLTNSFTKPGLQEQFNTTADQSDYLWYSKSLTLTGYKSFLDKDLGTTLHITALGHVLHVFVNGKLVESGKDAFRVITDTRVTFTRGVNKIDLLSATVGLKFDDPHFDTNPQGINGPVQLKQNYSEYLDLSSEQWTYQIGLKGEALGLQAGNSSLWDSLVVPKNQPLVWYKTTFDAPAGNDPIALNLASMGKGEAWVNGQSIGRYWPSYIVDSPRCNETDYGTVFKNCGKPTQSMYHVPRSWLKPSGNILVLFEEFGGDPTWIHIAERDTRKVCSKVWKLNPPPVDMWNSTQKVPTATLECPYPSSTISSVTLASYGTPAGNCGSFADGQCKSANSLSVVQKACMGKNSCQIGLSPTIFSGDPCLNVRNKGLAIEASCS